ncbi:MAG: serine/threonine-protein kinase [Pseudomonadota bacterium]
MADFEPKQFGKYYLIEKIAVGGMAEIYKAKTFGVDGFEKLLCIKRILPHCAADKDFITMLTDEAKLSVRLSHANIVQVFDLGKIGDDYFIAMEFINGINLRDVMYRCRELSKPIPQDIAVYIISEVCKGLDYAHNRRDDSTGQPLNIVHRDISPQNILLSYEGEVKIVDFGIAKAAMNISHTMAGVLKGKIAYMSPEQAMGKTIDCQTDIFSTGILLYEMLTNAKLFTGESQFEVLKKIRSARVDVKSLPDTIPDKLKAVVAKALAYNTQDRYQNAGDLQLDLTKHLYSSYVDFSPRKLAAFVKEIFQEELKKEQVRRAQEASLESQTASMSIDEGAKQVDIVHRDISEREALEKEALEEATDKRIVQKPKPIPKPKPEIRAKPKKGNSFLKAATVLLVLAGVGYGLYKYVPAMRFWEKPAEEIVIGLAKISSQPPGAKILLDGQDTKMTTPAELKDLEINKVYTLRLEKQGFQPLEESLKVASTEPLNLSLTLTSIVDKGLINIITEPPGAAILLEGKTTGKLTPSTLEDLPLKQDLKITLSKPKYKDYEQVINLQSTTPQKISTTLALITGSIQVESQPEGALISLNNKSTGKTTPALLEELNIGEDYNIKLTKKGYESWSQTIKVTDSSQAKLEGTLKQEPKKELPPSVTTKEPERVTKKEPARTTEPTPTKTVEEPEEPAVTSGAPGKIKIASKPSGAQVFVNAEYKGETPLTVSVSPGKISVLINKEGYTRVSRKVTVRPGQSVNLTDIQLLDLFGEVSIASTPPRAQVVFDNQQIPAKTPVTIRKVRRDQPHRVTVTLSGYKTWSNSFTMESGDKNFNVVLEKE